MKKVFMILLVSMLVSTVALAAQTDRGEYTTPFTPATNWLNTNDYFYHTHDYEQFEYKNPMGIGLDAILYEFEGESKAWGLDAIEVQQKWDMNNSAYELFGVCKVNLWRLFKKVT